LDLRLSSNDETITWQIMLFAAAVVAVVAISSRTRAQRLLDAPV
jgi:hypothetical protein